MSRQSVLLVRTIARSFRKCCAGAQGGRLQGARRPNAQEASLRCVRAVFEVVLTDIEMPT